MATYPNLQQWEGTKLIPRSGIMERVATNGAVRLRAFQSAAKYDIVVVHAFLTSDDRSTLLTFYADNKTGAFNFTATEDGISRNVHFAPNAYDIQPMQTFPALFQATVRLRET